MFAAVALFSTMRAHWAHYTRSLEFSINGGFNTSGPSRAITAQLQVNPPSGHAGNCYYLAISSRVFRPGRGGRSE